MPNRKYVLDLNDLQYKQIRLPWRKKLLRIFLWFAGTIAIALFYGAIIENFFGSPEEKVLQQQIDNLKLQYALVGKQFDRTMNIINSLKLSDEMRYRPILDMDSIPESMRNPGFGGVERFRELNGYLNSGLMISDRNKLEEIKNLLNVQKESFVSVLDRKDEWIREMEHIPWISPVKVSIKRGDGLKYRDHHPVLGTGQWHRGQDFEAPYGTEVFATGAGTVIEAGWNTSGFGNCVIIDHDYGFHSTYGHLSNIRVSKGMIVKRGDLVGLSGSTGISSGPHLHYQIDLYGQHKNPLYFINNDLSEDQYFEMIQTLSSSTKFR
jgi:murein DD-endopeptidase MepM/ murein hydrolase activator NlpD